MKRSRACDDLVALAAESSTHSTAPRQFDVADTWPPSLVDRSTHGSKRPRASVDSLSCSSSHRDEVNDFLLPRARKLTDVESCGNEDVALSPLRSSVEASDRYDKSDRFPLRRHSRELLLLRKKKQRVAEITSSFDGFGIHDDNDASTPRERKSRVGPIESRETSEPRFLYGLRFPHSSRCIDPLVKRQAPSFDMAALIMLSVPRKR